MIGKYLRRKSKLGINPHMQIIEPGIRTSDGERWQKHWERYLKKIPKQGLNNTKKMPSWWNENLGGSYKPEPTLPRRLDKIVTIGPFPQTPPFYYYAHSGTGKENLPAIKELNNQILDRLEDLYEKMDTVYVLSPRAVVYWKRKIRETSLYIRFQSRWIGMTMIQEAEFDVLDPPKKPTLLEVDEGAHIEELGL